MKVKDYINNYFNPSKVNFSDCSHNGFIEVASISEILAEIGNSEEEYENASNISEDYDFQLPLKRPTDSSFINNYIYIGLLAWEAYIQLEFNY